jgi:hypothetical protein
MPRTHSACLSYTWIAVAVVALPKPSALCQYHRSNFCLASPVKLPENGPFYTSFFMPHDQRTE